MNTFEQQLQDDDICISEELIARLHGATEDTVLELVGMPPAATALRIWGTRLNVWL